MSTSVAQGQFAVEILYQKTSFMTSELYMQLDDVVVRQQAVLEVTFWKLLVKYVCFKCFPSCVSLSNIIFVSVL